MYHNHALAGTQCHRSLPIFNIVLNTSTHTPTHRNCILIPSECKWSSPAGLTFTKTISQSELRVTDVLYPDWIIDSLCQFFFTSSNFVHSFFYAQKSNFHYCPGHKYICSFCNANNQQSDMQVYLEMYKGRKHSENNGLMARWTEREQEDRRMVNQCLKSVRI